MWLDLFTDTSFEKTPPSNVEECVQELGAFRALTPSQVAGVAPALSKLCHKYMPCKCALIEAALVAALGLGVVAVLAWPASKKPEGFRFLREPGSVELSLSAYLDVLGLYILACRSNRRRPFLVGFVQVLLFHVPLLVRVWSDAVFRNHQVENGCRRRGPALGARPWGCGYLWSFLQNG